MAEVLKAQHEKIEAIHNQVTKFLVTNFPDARANPYVSLTKAVVEEQLVLDKAMAIINAYQKEIPGAAYGELLKRLLLSYQTQVAVRATERRVREYHTAFVRSRRKYR